MKDVRDYKEFQIIAYCCLFILVIVGGLKILKSELDNVKFLDRNAICAEHEMRYAYARFDVCIDKKGQMWSMRDLMNAPKPHNP